MSREGLWAEGSLREGRAWKRRGVESGCIALMLVTRGIFESWLLRSL